jgi:glycosyltransferase involved in cell wall biosynthesis
MKIYGVCVVKNEGDIIRYSLTNAQTWADKIIVFDNGSTDGTWETVKEMSGEKIIAYKQDSRPYSDGLRADVFNAFKHELKNDDWWVIQDADEIFDDNPRDFIHRQIGYFHHINGKKIDFCFDLSQIDSINFAGEFSEDVRHFDHYTPEAWSEPRAIKHRINMEWLEKKIWPTHMGLVCENAINIRHYPLRSLNQIKKRWETRKNVHKDGGQLFDHWEREDWREYYARKAKNLKKVEALGSTFDKVDFVNDYRQGYLKRLAKGILHRSGILR